MPEPEEDTEDAKQSWYRDPTTVTLRKKINNDLAAAETGWRAVSGQSTDPAVREAYAKYVQLYAIHAGLGGVYGKR